jgi:flagellum-specific ATP synthase
MAELIRLGAYKKGSDATVDEAIALNGPLEAFLSQDKNERTDLAGGYGRLAEILGMPAPADTTQAATGAGQ